MNGDGGEGRPIAGQRIRFDIEVVRYNTAQVVVGHDRIEAAMEERRMG